MSLRPVDISRDIFQADSLERVQKTKQQNPDVKRKGFEEELRKRQRRSRKDAYHGGGNTPENPDVDDVPKKAGLDKLDPASTDSVSGDLPEISDTIDIKV